MERELDVLEDLGVDGLTLLVVEPDELHSEVSRQTVYEARLGVDGIPLQRGGQLRDLLLDALSTNQGLDSLCFLFI